MQIDEWFKQLHEQLATIEQNWPDAEDQEKRRMAEQLLRLRQLSDHIVDAWLALEERLSSVIKEVKAREQHGESTEPQAGLSLVKEALSAHPQEEKTVTTGKGTDQVSPAAEELQQVLSDEPEDDYPSYALLFRKGEGFYHLRLFHDAKHHFAQLLKQSPDWENGRLYYGYSLLFCQEREEAMREFRLLSRTASSPKVKAISDNAIGCMIAEEKHWLEAGQAFKAALETMPDHPEATFNLALCYLHGGEAQESLETIESYLEKDEDDWEAQVLWLRAYKLLIETDPASRRIPPSGLKIPSRQLDVKALQEMANMCEKTGQIRRAQLCYRYLLEHLPREGWVWHGLAWNSWLLAGAKVAIPMVKKAIALAPDNLDFVFSYGWMELFEGELSCAQKVFESNLRHDHQHTLSLSGLITVFTKQEEWSEARQLAHHLLQSDSSYERALGHYHLGRIGIACEEWGQAEKHFQIINRTTNDFWEVPLFLKLCADRLGHREWSSQRSLLPH
ncbi:tetratricopeptide repeat protein [Brevibacillus humidisoli]|uniref:tetratricopeptide repeat protein n=1 Tax=Brevibacillus humidisoli TaxID=2895522 RepID=UPI001E3868DB|nr:tetratricopeptide repeat protein [Brevibacillus humidisoli]UFJ42744.1 tetratricopeptide repeat protein [Brevibacillus humidisoli]